MYKIQSGVGRTTFIDKKKFLYFSGTAYLGIPQNTEFKQLLFEGLDKYGSNYGGSRRSNIAYDIFENAEHLLAKITGAPAALTLSSGTLAGQLLASFLSTKGSFWATADAHPAMLNQAFHIQKLGKDWQKTIVKIAKKQQTPIVLFANAINPLQVEDYSFDWLENLPPNLPFTLVVDDSHSIGICGENGSGVWATIKVPEQVELIIISSLGKAFGVPAGVILGSKKLIQSLWKSSLFGGASPALPAYLHAFICAQEIYQENRQLLFENIEYFTQNTPQINQFKSIKKYPVFSIQNDDLAHKLFEQNILISAFHYPAPTSPLLTRVVLSSLHRKADIDDLILALNAKILI